VSVKFVYIFQSLISSTSQFRRKMNRESERKCPQNNGDNIWPDLTFYADPILDFLLDCPALVAPSVSNMITFAKSVAAECVQCIIIQGITEISLMHFNDVSLIL